MYAKKKVAHGRNLAVLPQYVCIFFIKIVASTMHLMPGKCWISSFRYDFGEPDIVYYCYRLIMYGCR
jgi:hypothetical protein